MKSTTLCTLLLCFIPVISSANDTQTNQSIVFEKNSTIDVPPETPIGNKTNLQLKNGGTDEYCNDLLQKIEDLKGKPLRRTAARERYELECTSSQGLEGF